MFINYFKLYSGIAILTLLSFFKFSYANLSQPKTEDTNFLEKLTGTGAFSK